jgi:hypothetical protein
MPPLLITLLVVLAAYLLGSVPFALVASRLFGLADPRSYGSGNPGATNVLRSGHKGAAVLTLIGDAAKGAPVNGQRGRTAKAPGGLPAPPACRRRAPASAIIAPLSVQNSSSG